MTPNVFLSLSGTDDEFASRVWELLPRGLATFYRRSFENGAALLEEMERGNRQSAVFVLLASRASVESVWVNFEIDQARLQTIADDKHRILVFRIDEEVSPSSLPKWMQSHWVPGGVFNPQDVARQVLNTLLQQIENSHPGYRAILGRGPLLDKVVQLSMDSVLTYHRSPNVFVLSGVNQIGRRSFSKQLLKALFPTLPNVGGGPTLEMPLFGDIVDLYRSTRSQIDQHASVDSVAEDLSKFQQMSEADQVGELILSLSHFSSLGQAITFVIGQGLFDSDGT